jgi:hypothetical protein
MEGLIMDKIIWGISEKDVKGLSELDLSLMLEEMSEILTRFQEESE